MRREIAAGRSRCNVAASRPPWSVDELEACFVVKDGGGQKLAFVYYEEEPQRRDSAKLLAKDEARRIAANIAKLPELLLRQPKSKTQ